jgi:hypothetical protein
MAENATGKGTLGTVADSALKTAGHTAHAVESATGIVAHTAGILKEGASLTRVFLQEAQKFIEPVANIVHTTLKMADSLVHAASRPVIGLAEAFSHCVNRLSDAVNRRLAPQPVPVPVRT